MIALAAMLLLVMSSLQSCTPLAQSVLQSVIIGTYPAEEEDVKAAERAYAEVAGISWHGEFHRHDIGWRALEREPEPVPA